MTTGNVDLLRHYVGALETDDDLQTSTLIWSEGDEDIRAVMQLDTHCVGAYDPAQVVAAWEMFTEDYGHFADTLLTVRAFLNADTQSILHVFEVLE